MMTSLVTVFAYLLIQMCVIWFLYRLLENPSVVDVSWSLGLIIAGLIYLWQPPFYERNVVIGLLLILWGLRLAGYLYISRLLKGQVDPRYTKLSDSWKISRSLGFFLNFQLQGILIFIVSTVFFWIRYSNIQKISFYDGIIFLGIIFSILGEAIADIQLQKFKKNRPGKVCDYGLWAYSRHPNYFFDWLTWLGFSFLALDSKNGVFALISPLLLYYIFNYVTGPITEKGSIESRGQDYLAYQAKTPMFFLNFKKLIFNDKSK